MSNVNRAIELAGGLVTQWETKSMERASGGASLTHTLPSRYPNNGLRKEGVTITSADRRVATDLIYNLGEDEAPEQARILQITQELYTGPYSGKREIIFFNAEGPTEKVETVQQEVFEGFGSLKPMFVYQRGFTYSMDESERMSAIVLAPKDALHFQLLYSPANLSMVTFHDRLGRSDYHLVEGEEGPALEFSIWPEATSRLETAARMNNPDKYERWVGAGLARRGERIPLVGEHVSIRGGKIATSIDPEKIVEDVINHSRIERVLDAMKRGE